MANLKERIRDFIIGLRMMFLRHLGMSIDKNAKESLKAHLDKTNPKGIYIGRYSYVGGALWFWLMIL